LCVPWLVSANQAEGCEFPEEEKGRKSNKKQPVGESGAVRQSWWRFSMQPCVPCASELCGKAQKHTKDITGTSDLRGFY
jgi:hypothetical protein